MKTYQKFIEDSTVLTESGLEDYRKTHGIKAHNNSTGYSEKEKKWYGWSHRGIFGFGIGHVVNARDIVADAGIPVGFKAKTMADCKKLAQVFAKGVA